MAKTSKLQKHERQQKLVQKYAAKRAELKEIIRKGTSPEAIAEARESLSALPWDSNPVRVHNRCQFTGRPHGYYRKFGLCRNQLRQMAHEGKLPGVVKSSW
jgi:small subunit ribosomal protein S14